ncbi:ParA family protein [Nocardioides sp.]|uniref:ParA family protein n=1 Tax=Nocardioides sp. TaxID=35761 RepID=UPI003D0E7210
MPATSVVVLSGKGGTAKTLWQMTMAGEASRAGLSTLLVDVDPERNLSNRFGVPQHSTGLGSVFEQAGVTTGEGDAELGAKRAVAEILSTPWANVDLLPAGASLTGISQVAIADTWLLRDILTAAALPDRYDLILLDTGGRTGSLVTLAMYAADVAYAPIAPTTDAVRKATEARVRVDRIQRAHPLRWAGVVLSGFDGRVGIEEAIRANVYEEFGEQVRADVPRRAAVNEAFQLGDRLGDRTDVATASLAQIFLGFLLRDLMQRDDLLRVPAGVLR